MNKLRSGNYFEDFRIGQRLVHGTPRTLTEADQSLYIALTGSRSCLHSADTVVRAAGFERRPLEDLLVFNTAFGKTVPDISLNAVANLGYAELRFLEPVYGGDTLSVESEVLGLKENSSRKSGVVYVRSSVRNQHGREVLGWIRWVMVHKRDAAADCPVQTVPATQARVPSAALSVGHFSDRIGAVLQGTGVEDVWEDYVPGERIDHGSAVTVNDSDHSMATRLYQNTAKGHFDAHAMASTPMGRRLVYGGHVMSLCKALAYDGLENMLGMLAINAGSHLVPTFAGDTLCCATTVLEKIDLPDAPVGALRLRMIGAKNIDSAASIVFPPSGARHAPEAVLDLDFTVAFPKRTTA
jgi:2-methylfumaryl-CoA hydratase